MQTIEIAIEPIDRETADDLGDTVRGWFAGWSPGNAPWNGEAFRNVFKAGAGAVEIVDDMGGTIVTLDSVDAYIATWTPFMAPFAHWAIAPVGPVRARVADDLAVVTFTFQADAKDADGRPLLPKPGQHGTLVLERTRDGWRVIREHLTTIAQPASVLERDGI